MNTVNITRDDWDRSFSPMKTKTGGIIDFHPKVASEERIEILKKAIPENKVWTMIADDYGNIIIVDGYRRVNRIDVYITEVPYEKNTHYIVE